MTIIAFTVASVVGRNLNLCTSRPTARPTSAAVEPRERNTKKGAIDRKSSFNRARVVHARNERISGEPKRVPASTRASIARTSVDYVRARERRA